MIRVIVSVVFIAALPAIAAAQGAAPLTVDDAVRRALAESHRLAEAQARHESARAAVQARQAAERPTLNVSAGYTRTNHVDEFGVPQPNGVLRVIYPDLPDNYFSRATLQWPIYTAGRADALIRAAEAEARATDAEIRTARADLRLEVVRAYWALVTATESVRVLEEGLMRADAHLADVRSRFAAGLIPPNEVSSVEAQRARHEMQLIEARNVRLATLEDLRRLTGITTDIAVPTFTPAEIGALPAPQAQPEAVSSSARSELDALRARVEAADERVDAMRAMRRPTIAFTAAADYANPNSRIFPRADLWRTSWELGVVASWTLWDGGRAEADVAEAAAAARALRARQADVQALIDTDIRQRQLDLDSAHAALAAANAAVRAASEARRVLDERFAVGVATSTDVLDAQGALLQAELDRTRALANIRLAEARLQRALGL